MKFGKTQKFQFMQKTLQLLVGNMQNGEPFRQVNPQNFLRKTNPEEKKNGTERVTYRLEISKNL